MEIREICDFDDIIEISDIYVQSWKHAYRHIIPQDYLDMIKKEQWCHSLASQGRHSLVLIEHDKIIGTSSYGPSRYQPLKEAGEIYSIYLLPQYCYHGYGCYLLNDAIDRLKNNGHSQIFLWVLEENQSARHFYEKNGFHENGLVIEKNIGGKILTEICYIQNIV